MELTKEDNDYLEERMPLGDYYEYLQRENAAKKRARRKSKLPKGDSK